MANKQIKVTLVKSLAGQLKNITASVRGPGPAPAAPDGARSPTRRRTAE